MRRQRSRDEAPSLLVALFLVLVGLFVFLVLFGVFVLTHEGPPLTYESALLLGLLVSAIHGAFALAARFRERRRRGAGPPE